MGSDWNHPSFGKFERDGSTVSTTLKVPAFARFSYDTGYFKARRSTGKFSLSFRPWMSNEKLAEPTPEMVKLAEEILTDPDQIVDLVADGLWEEFNGRGPTIGMWWYGGLEAVRGGFDGEGLALPQKPEDVLPALQLYAIDVFTQLTDYPKPVGVLTFHAAFEQEHGVCVVTDGKRVLGSSYASEPEIGK